MRLGTRRDFAEKHRNFDCKCSGVNNFKIFVILIWKENNFGFSVCQKKSPSAQKHQFSVSALLLPIPA